MTTVQNESPTASPGKSGRRAWWIFGGALTATVLVLALIAAGAWIWTASSPTETSRHAETYAQPIAGVDLDISVGEVDLTASGGSGLEVEREQTWKGPEPRIDEELTDEGVFEASAGCREGVFFWLNSHPCEIDYALGVPSGTAVEVRTATAAINVDGLDGDMRLEAGTGDIDGRNLRTSGTSVEAGTGRIVLSFDEVLADIDVEAGVGDVTILVPDDGTTYEIQFDEGVGDEEIDIATDPGTKADYVINVSIGVGDLEVRYTD